jgi:quercetin dioxygenase-like cupin family protein
MHDVEEPFMRTGGAEAKVIRSADVEPVSFGPLAEYRRLTGQDGLPIFTGIQTCAPGYATPLHWHPYVECLFVLEGVMEACVEGQEDMPARLEAGDMIALPADTPHIFRTVGEQTLRILGIHASPVRIVNVVSDLSATL